MNGRISTVKQDARRSSHHHFVDEGLFSHKQYQGGIDGCWNWTSRHYQENKEADTDVTAFYHQTIRKGPHPRLHPGQAQPEAYNLSRSD